MISLAMPTYNGERFLKEQLDSIYNQTIVPDEVIVVDDCSTDGTISILEEYKKKYGLKYWVNEKNLGYNKNFEKAISLCTGDYIVLSDQDDVWFPHKIEESYNRILAYPSDEPSLVSSHSIAVDENLTPLPIVASDIQGGDWRLNLTRYYSQGCTLMMNRALLNYILPFPDEMIYDAYIGLTASLIGNRFYIPKNLMYYRFHGANSYASDIAKSPSYIYSRLSELHAYVPFWYKKNDQYRFLLFMKNKLKGKISPERELVMDKVIRIFEVGKIRRMFLFLSLKGPSTYQKIKISIALILKTLFFIEDKY